MKRVALFFLILFFTFSLQSQKNTFVFTHLSNQDGLSQNSVMTMHQDKLGQMWIGTRDGLNKYDGTKITVYRTEFNNPNSISNDHILSIEEDSNGNLWFGTLNGLNLYNPKTNLFTRYYRNKTENSLGNNTIWDIKELSDGNLWIATDNGITVYDTFKKTFMRYLYQSDKIMGTRVKCFLETKNNDFYIGTTTGLIKVEKNHASNNITFKTLNKSLDFFIQDLKENKNGNILIATKKNRIVFFNPKKNIFKDYLIDSNLKENILNFKKIIFDKNDRIWAGTYKGLLIIEPNKSVTVLKANIFDEKGLTSESIRTVYKDKSESIWIGTFYGGINIWNDINNNFRKILQDNKKNGLNFNVVSSIVKDKQHIYYGTEGGGINIYNKKTDKYEYITTLNSNLKGNNIKALEYTKDGKLWMAIFEHGIQVYNTKNKKFTANIISKKLENFIINKNIYDIVSDKENNIWLGVFGKGVIKYNPKTKKFINFWTEAKNNTYLSSSLVRSLLIDNNKNVWVATDKGLNKITPEGVIENFFFSKEVEYGEKILCIYQDNSKQLWVSVKSKGLFKFNGKSFNYINLISNDKTKPSINSILEDNANNLWLSSNKGIIRYNTNNKNTRVYTKVDEGHLNTDFISNSSLKIGSSEFYFGGSKGVTYFNSNSIKKNNFTSKVIITDIKIRGKNTTIKHRTPKLVTTAPFTKSIDLKHNQGNFTISFSLPNFNNTINNIYKYRLKGLEQKWNTSNTAIASYTIQRSGNYIFEVVGANSDGVWNNEITTLKINVAPAPWLTIWAFIGYGILLYLLFYLYIRILKSREKLKHKLDLEQVSFEKNKELNKKKIQFFTNISHDFRTPLTLISGPLQQIIENYSGSRKTYNQLKIIEKNTNHLLLLINRLLDFKQLENNIFKLEATESNIVNFLKEICISFTEYAKIGGYNFEFNADEDDIFVYYDTKKLERLFYNLISNAFKYTPKKGEIIISVTKQSNDVKITIKDSGIGIKKAHLQKIFNRYFKVDVNSSKNKHFKGSGMGLSIAKDIVQLHKGNINVQSEGINKGTLFTVTLPLGKTHLNTSDIINDTTHNENTINYNLNTLQNTPIEDKDLEYTKQNDRPTVLIAEDNKQLRIFIKNLLSKNYNILEAKNGEVAFSIAKSKSPNLIISDVVMPKMDGVELCKSIKEELSTSHIPFILLTSKTSLAHKLTGLEQGADAYLNKPFDINELKITINNLLQNIEILKQKFQSNESFDDTISHISSSDEILYKKAIEIVKKNIGNDAFDISFFASELGVSRTMLFTKIKAWTNYTPNEFINHFKMKLAAKLLEQGNLNISQISYRIGFKTPKYFSKSFRKKYNQSPSEYALKFKENKNIKN